MTTIKSVIKMQLTVSVYCGLLTQFSTAVKQLSDRRKQPFGTVFIPYGKGISEKFKRI
jgi:hypothetical protein